MALTLVDVGADLILNTMFMSTAVQNLKLKLFATDVTPADTNTLGTYTEAAGGGYAEITLTRGTDWTLTVGNDPSDVVCAEKTFTFTGTLTTNPTIYGYMVTDNAGSVLVWAEKLGTSFTPANNGDQLKITPKFALSKGTPT